MKVNEIEVNYIDYGKKEGKPLVFLHGWGQNIEMMKPIADPFQSEYRIIILDLPGHGKSTEPPYAWQFEEFVDFLRRFLKKIGVENPILLGHSFGGKISLLYASEYNVEKLVVFGSPYKKEIQKLSLKTKVLKQLKKVPVLKQFEEFAKKHIGSTDYKNASKIMREILVNHVNYDITEQTKKIKAPTLIVWGSKDEAVPVEDAYILEKNISNAGVVLYDNCTHYAYLERLNQTISVLQSFFDSKE